MACFRVGLDDVPLCLTVALPPEGRQTGSGVGMGGLQQSKLQITPRQ
jgi:hypothetical protein